MQTKATAAPGPLCVARGYGIKIHVRYGRLVIEDGAGRDRQLRRYARASSKLKRLVLVGHSGFVTLEALRWLHDQNAALVHIDTDGQLLTTSTAAGTDTPALRRAQALAQGNSVGVEITRGLLKAKVEGQASLLDDLPGGARATGEVDLALREMRSTGSLSALLAAEAHAAAAYWGAWADLPITLSSRGRRPALEVQDHWCTFGQRRSLLSSGPRHASNPANAILNYLYALLEAETILACQRVGLDPGLGIFHTDQRGRASLALDAMEAARPAVDAYVLALLTQRMLSTRHFTETRHGVCRLNTKLTTELAATLPSWQGQVAPVIERVMHQLVASSPRMTELTTPLTRANHRVAWDAREPGRKLRQPRLSTLTLPATCRDCGAELPSRRHRYCQACREQRFARHGSRGRQNAAQVLASLREEGRDPGHGGHAAQLRGSKNAAHQRAVKEWDGSPGDSAVFMAEISPRLRGVPIRVLADASGLSHHYCSLIRLGKRVPHVRHWRTFEDLAETSCASASIGAADTSAQPSAAKVHRSRRMGDQTKINRGRTAQSGLTVCGLFAGIGGIEAGLSASGHHASLLCDVDPGARSVLQARFPQAKISPDVLTLRRLPTVGLVTAGFPCSDLSQAGRTEGIEGRNSGLVGELFRLLDRSRRKPDWLLLENVPFMLSLAKGAAMRWLVTELERRDFMWAYRVIDSRAFGLPQRRPRVILLASRNNDPRPSLLGPDVGQPQAPRRQRHLWKGFYWTEGNRGTGLVLDAIPPLKNGSTLGIPSPPAMWARDTRRIVTPALHDAERLQGFPTGWTQPAATATSGRPEGARWRLVGNAVSVPTAAWIGTRLGTADTYSAASDVEFQSDKSWPAAAWGVAGDRCRAEASPWPVRTAQPHLHDFLQSEPKPLSARAAAGFHRRLVASPLRVPKGLLKDLERHVRAMSGLSS